MRSAVVLVLSLAPVVLGAASAPAGKLDPFLRKLATARQETAAPSRPPFLQVRQHGQRTLVDVKGRLAAGTEGGIPLRAALARFGAELRGRVGDIVSLRVPVESLAAVAALPELRWLKASRRYSITNELSTGASHTASDQANLEFGDGANVIVAVVDTGVDWTNPDFRNADGSTRLLGIWDQTLTDPLHPPPPGLAFGAFYSREDIDAALDTAGTLLTHDVHGHGTHVLGTAAGNGRSTGNGIAEGTFAGVAPEADLLAVRVFAGPDATFCDDCDLVAAVEFIAGVATAEGKPWVGNMSLGDSIGGAHDGTSADELAIDAAVGPGRPGAQLAVSAGNEGRSTRHFHWQGTLGAGQTLTNTFVLPPTQPAAEADNDFVWLDLWYEGVDAVRMEVVTPGGTVVDAERGASSGIVCTPDGAVEVDATNAPDPENGDNQVFVQIWDAPDCVPVVEPASGTWTLRIVVASVGAGGGPFDLWNAATARGLAWVDLSTFDLSKSVAIPATCRHCLTAGSYVDKSQWLNNANPQTTTTAAISASVGARSAFSSVGPTRDGRIKPDIVAPGEFVGSTISSFDATPPSSTFQERDGRHHNIRGTSMAAPHVAGAAALLLGVNATLDGAQLRSAMQRSARTDAFTGAVPNVSYGYGKLRALEGGYEAATQVTDLRGLPGGGLAGTPNPRVASYNVYRGSLSGLPAGNYGTCFLAGLPSPAFSDGATPASGQAFTYLVAGVYVDPVGGGTVEGSLGTDSLGRERPNVSPCP